MATAEKEETEYVEIVEALQTKHWVEVDIDDLNLEDMSCQFRLSGNVASLRRSLTQEGQREPIDLTGKKPYRIIDGFRRVEAAQDLSWPSVKAFVHPNLGDDGAFRLAFTKNVVRRNLGPLEKANAMFLAKKRGIENDQLAELFGLSEKQVRRYLALLDFPLAVQEVLDGKVVTMAHAKLLVDFRASDPASWAKRIEDEGLDAKSLRRELRKTLGRKPAGRRKLYVKREKGRVRFYPFTVSVDSPPEEKQRVIQILEQTLALLKKDGKARSSRS